MSEFWRALLLFLCGAGGLAIINAAQKRWEMRFDRKAKKEDRVEEKNDQLAEFNKNMRAFIEEQKKFNEKSDMQDKEMQKQMEELRVQMEAVKDGMKYVLLDRIIYLGHSYIKDGEVSFDNRKRLGDMHSVYHENLNGNGDADTIMEGVYALPLKK